MPERTHVLEVLRDRHIRVQRNRLRQVADPSPDLERLVDHVETGDFGVSLAGRHETRQDPHRRRLAAPLGPRSGTSRGRLKVRYDGRMDAVVFRQAAVGIMVCADPGGASG
jgi:hypothetical protein